MADVVRRMQQGHARISRRFQAGCRHLMLTADAPLRTALQAHALRAVRWLADTGAAAAIVTAAEEAGAAPLCLAALDACREAPAEAPALLRALLSAGANACLADEVGQTALHAAALMGCAPEAAECVRALLPPAAAAAPGPYALRDGFGRTALHCALVALGCRIYVSDLDGLVDEARKEIARFQQRSDDRSAAEGKEHLGLLLQLRARLESECAAAAGVGQCSAAAAALLPLLLGPGGGALMEQDAEGRPPLALASHLPSDGEAAAAAAAALVPALTALGPSELAKAVQDAALHAVARFPGGAPLLRAALSAGGSASVRSEDGALALHVAHGGEAAAALLEAYPLSLNARNKAGQVPLFTLCAADDAEAVKVLLGCLALRTGDAAKAYDRRGPGEVAGAACAALLKQHSAEARARAAEVAEARRRLRAEEEKEALELQALTSAAQQGASDMEWAAQAEAALASLPDALARAASLPEEASKPAATKPADGSAADEPQEAWFDPKLAQVTDYSWQLQASSEFRAGVLACDRPSRALTFETLHALAAGNWSRVQKLPDVKHGGAYAQSNYAANSPEMQASGASSCLRHP